MEDIMWISRCVWVCGVAAWGICGCVLMVVKVQDRCVCQAKVWDRRLCVYVGPCVCVWVPLAAVCPAQTGLGSVVLAVTAQACWHSKRALSRGARSLCVRVCASAWCVFVELTNGPQTNHFGLEKENLYLSIYLSSLVSSCASTVLLFLRFFWLQKSFSSIILPSSFLELSISVCVCVLLHDVFVGSILFCDCSSRNVCVLPHMHIWVPSHGLCLLVIPCVSAFACWLLFTLSSHQVFITPAFINHTIQYIIHPLRVLLLKDKIIWSFLSVKHAHTHSWHRLWS